MLLLAMVVVAVIELTRGGGAGAVAGLANSVAAIDPRSNVVDADVAVGNAPSSISVGEHAVWVLNADDQTISMIEPKSVRLLKTFATGSQPTDLGAGGGTVWVGRGRSVATSPVVGSLVPSAISRV
jgi:virginiamycin B lyase